MASYRSLWQVRLSCGHTALVSAHCPEDIDEVVVCDVCIRYRAWDAVACLIWR